MEVIFKDRVQLLALHRTTPTIPPLCLRALSKTLLELWQPSGCDHCSGKPVQHLTTLWGKKPHPDRSGILSASLPPAYGQGVQDQQLLEFNGNSSVEAGETVSAWREGDMKTTTTPGLEEGVLTLLPGSSRQCPQRNQL